MKKRNPAMDARQVLSTCYRCEEVPKKSCTVCGNFFCSNHGGERYTLKSDDGKTSLKKKMICDDCTPNQTIMGVVKYIMILIVIIITVTIIGMTVYNFFIVDHSIPSGLEPQAPVEPIKAVDEKSSKAKFIGLHSDTILVENIMRQST